ncbi:MAG: hypothetical protein EZS28_027530 [Streblomastix strix]|uniref:Uncharacterized protein n=1 Tax=Streblomastix strix TaxID=222440 RepID=A0A5J4V356_9EUKA|nr:MAG: hypothetical protein EZS28_027530 [Streblomastix strix]
MTTENFAAINADADEFLRPSDKCKNAKYVIIIIQQDVKIVENEKDDQFADSDSELKLVMNGVREDAEQDIASERMECEILSHIEQLLANEVKQLHERSNTLSSDLKKRESEIMYLRNKKDHDDMNISTQIAELLQRLNKQSESLEKMTIQLLVIEKIWEANRNVLIVLQAENVANQASMREILEAKQRQNELSIKQLNKSLHKNRCQNFNMNTAVQEMNQQLNALFKYKEQMNCDIDYIADKV